MNYREHLIATASVILAAGNPLPVDLEAKLESEGVILDELETSLEQNNFSQ